MLWLPILWLYNAGIIPTEDHWSLKTDSEYSCQLLRNCVVWVWVSCGLLPALVSDLGQDLIGAGGHSSWARLGGGVWTSTGLMMFSLSFWSWFMPRDNDCRTLWNVSQHCRSFVTFTMHGWTLLRQQHGSQYRDSVKTRSPGSSVRWLTYFLWGIFALLTPHLPKFLLTSDDGCQWRFSIWNCCRGLMTSVIRHLESLGGALLGPRRLPSL